MPCRERVLCLVKKYRTNELKTKTGTEEQRSRRGTLLQEIISIVDGKQVAIDEELAADEDEVISESQEEGTLMRPNNRINPFAHTVLT